jgi:RNA polymerase sigma-70 factor (ECF subfamily)
MSSVVSDAPGPEDPADAVLAAKAEHERFLTLFLAHEEDLRDFIFVLVRDRHRADDVFQEVALVLWRRFGDYDPARPFGPWARGIARNKFLKDMDDRTTQKQRQLPLELVDAVEAAFVRSDALPSMELEALAQCLERVPAHARTMLDLRYREGLPIDLVAQRVKRSLAAVTKMLSRMRVQLADCITERLTAGG